jgi:hypothetical protein
MPKPKMIKTRRNLSRSQLVRTIVALFLACCSYAAHGETILGLGEGSCNVAQTTCSVPNDAGDTITFIYDRTNGQATLVVTSVSSDLEPTTVTYTGPLELGAATTSTNYLVLIPFTATLSPAATLTGNIRKTRSGSGRGGWAWHSHWEFQTLVIY